jgi:hypothetical protein
MIRLRLGPGKVGLTEYIDFKLYEDDISLAAKLAFAGQRMQAVVEEILIDDYSRFLSLDKVTMYALLSAHGVPIPKLKAVYRTLRPASITQLQTPAELAAFLAAAGNLPVYIKPSFGAYGRGNALVTAIRGQDVVLGNGRLLPIADYCGSLDNGRSLGWILQQPLDAHSEIVRLTGSARVSGVRVHTFWTDEGSKVIKAVLKINTGQRESDNFEHGASGNMLGAVDLNTGMVIRAVSGIGLGQRTDPCHPATGLRIEGFRLPHWAEVVRIVTDAHAAFPGFLCPGWDVALCEDGPRVLEVNAFGDIDLSQHAYRCGFLEGAFLAWMRERGLDRLLSAPAMHGSRSPINYRMGRRKHHWLW